MRLSDAPQPIIRRVAFEASSERVPKDMSFVDFLMALHGWRFRGVFKGEACLGAVMDREGVVHISILPEFRCKWAGRKIIKEIIDSSRKSGKLLTFINRGDSFRAEFARRLGFVFVGAQGEMEMFKHE